MDRLPLVRHKEGMHGNRILVVDDEVGIRELLSEILIDEGYDDTAGEEALALFI